MEKIAIVNVHSIGRDFPEHIEVLEEIGEVNRFLVDKNETTKNLISMLSDYTYIIMGTSPILTAEFFDYMPNLKLITRHGIGFNHIDLDAAKKHGVYVCNITGLIEQDAVAEQASALLSALSKKLLLADDMVRNKQWKVDRGRLMGYALSEKVTGIIGCGNIGSRFREIMKYGFKNKILIYDPFLDKSDYGDELVDLQTLLKEADFISLHANLTENNYHMIAKPELSMMKSSALLINTARGALIDEMALYEALKNQSIAGFGADVLTSEPVEEDNPLLKLSNTIFTPHVGVYNYSCIKNMDKKVMRDIELVRNNKRPIDIVNGL